MQSCLLYENYASHWTEQSISNVSLIVQVQITFVVYIFQKVLIELIFNYLKPSTSVELRNRGWLSPPPPAPGIAK
jgi:hypothetical protein